MDALRGLFLVWMTLTHLPTRFSDLVNQPFGFVSSAEGFVFVSALLVSLLYSRQAVEDTAHLRTQLWRRALKIYSYHLLLLTLAFTVAAGVALTTHRAALNNLLDFYLAHPVIAVLGSVLLLYCPPLLDILPMYIIFMAITPLLLPAAVRWGWKRVLAASWAVWLLAQFGLRDALHHAIVWATGLQIPLQETGAFNLLAWQIVWVMGLWVGARLAVRDRPFQPLPRAAIGASAAVCAFFIAVRHEWLGPRLTTQGLGMQLDKWSIGPLRLLNLMAFGIVMYWLRKYVVRAVSLGPFLTLGRASLEVFCTHIFFVFAGLALVAGDVPMLHGFTAAALVLVTFAGLFFVALRVARVRQIARAAALARSSQQPPNGVRSDPL